MANPITKELVVTVVQAAVAALPDGARPEDVAKRVVTDPAIAPTLEPISRMKSETLQGIVVAAAAPLVVAGLKAAGVEIADSDAANIIATLITLAGAVWAWYGRETATRQFG